MIGNKRVDICRYFRNPMMKPSNAEAVQSKPIQLSSCIPRFGNPTDNSISSEFTSYREMKAVSDCHKKVDSATQQKPKHEVHTCFPRRLVTFSSANRPIRGTNPYPNTWKPHLICKKKKLRLSCKKRILEAECGWHVQSKRDDGKKEKK